MSNDMWVRCTAGVGSVFLGPAAAEHMAYGKRIPLEKPAEQQEIKQTQMRAEKTGGAGGRRLLWKKNIVRALIGVFIYIMP